MKLYDFAFSPNCRKVRGVNGGAGVAFHRDGELRAIEAVEVRDGKLLRMHHFMQPAVIAAFARAAR